MVFFTFLSISSNWKLLCAPAITMEYYFLVMETVAALAEMWCLHYVVCAKESTISLLFNYVKYPMVACGKIIIHGYIGCSHWLDSSKLKAYFSVTNTVIPVVGLLSILVFSDKCRWSSNLSHLVNEFWFFSLIKLEKKSSLVFSLLQLQQSCLKRFWGRVV